MPGQTDEGSRTPMPEASHDLHPAAQPLCTTTRRDALLLVFQHSGARDFDLGGGFHYSGSYPMVFQHSGARDFDLGGGFHYSGSYPMAVGREILT
jgi:hypothetical protein